MSSEKIKRVYVEKREGFNIESKHLKTELKETLGVIGLEGLRILNRYDFEVQEDSVYEQIKKLILSEPNVDKVYDEDFPHVEEERFFAMEYLPGQYDQRADSAAQCIQILLPEAKSKVKTAKVILLRGKISDNEFIKIKDYCINPVDSREASLEILQKLTDDLEEPNDIEVVEGFISFNDEKLDQYRKEKGFAMSKEDMVFVKEYFEKDEKRNPTVTELKVIDTYWSDHCRHTTFFTEIRDIQIEEGPYKEQIESTLKQYLASREYIETKKPITLMDLGTINTKLCRKMNLLEDLDQSEEINACSIKIDVDVDGQTEKWLLMFKNETHNHPTEIEPFGGAATCLGGAIRDPLSGRSYVYQAMRVTGSGDPRKSIDETIPGKLSQRKISKEAAKGFSSYGNQIGLATGQVTEIYHPGYIAKRMEVGAVIGAAPQKNVVREEPLPGDIVVIIGGRTGRDGCGGATGSSKAHTEESLTQCGAEVQKGNPPEERKIQRLFRKPKVTKLIKRCNDFGAGGVSVAIGELADSLDIDLDAVPKKYEGLNGTELAISESQERMAVVIAAKDLDDFISFGHEENLEVTKVAYVTASGRLIMKWRNKVILDLSRAFLNTNGAKQYADVIIDSPKQSVQNHNHEDSLKERFVNALQNLNACSQQGLGEMFDSSIGAGSVLMPYGGKYALTPAEGMAGKIPVLKGETNTCSLMSYGFDPEVCEWSPYHGGIYSVVESVAKIVAMGGDYRKIRLSMQEYFERLEKDPIKWGKPFSALLGAYFAQDALGIAAIGGKDSMSGTFNDLTVPPTMISFAVTVDKAENVLSPEFKETGSKVYLVEIKRDEKEIPDFEELKEKYSKIKNLINQKVILSAKTIGKGGIGVALAKMSFGNKIGVSVKESFEVEKLFDKSIGSILVEVKANQENQLENQFILIGETIEEESIKIGKDNIDLDSLVKAYELPLSKVYPIKEDEIGDLETLRFETSPRVYKGEKIGTPRVFIPVFPGTNCEYDSIKAFEKAGATVESMVFKNLSSQDIEESLKNMAKQISEAQILMMPGGFSAGDEPDGSGKFIATIFRNPYITEAIMELLNKRDGLILGICNGFQALIKLGLVPYGEIRPLAESAPTLTYNKIGRHISRLSMTKVVSNLSPWLNKAELGQMYNIPMSHGEGRFVANESTLQELIDKGQIATQYVDLSGNASYDGLYNPNGSLYAVEGITSPDGRVLGKMGHSERIGKDIHKNQGGEKNQFIFESGVEYFKI
ncbi:phosphoribosylformylglycinamidine synthase [Alkalibaculum bacchi]|uniref:phosphoribosylformylglycinamidine synthase n=1 Tax=Alkalibaculum bacchi TaxID=645887 RepID=UPI0026EB37C0|nr:phosphoribosylformylglycinamidine synthase [Alkalibaculum bacchi]